MSDVEVLLKENNNLNSKIRKLNEELSQIRQMIKQNEQRLFKACKHEWVYDSTCGPYDKIKYQCKICNCYRNHYMYL